MINFDSISKKIKVFDNPDKKLKIHKKKTSLLGGTILIINFILFFIINLLFQNIFFELTNKEISFFLFLVISFYLIGLYDDIYKIIPNLKLFLVIASTFLVVIFYPEFSLKLIKISFIEKNYFFNQLSIPFTILSFALLANAFNMFDGIDLQLIIYSIFIFLFFLFKDIFLILSLVILISLLFLFYLNLKKKIFLGDSGAFALSGIVGFIFVYNYNNDPLFISSDEIFLLLMVPGIDMLRLFTMRIYRKKNPFKGDLNHLHHLLKQKYENILKVNFILSLFYTIPFIFLLVGVKSYVILSIYCVMYIYSLKYLSRH
ncbi:hypothetical protein IDG48_04760 [Pelagibacterales bacterium SAG-MED12]|nr:hypothetical protein [Pelagibacterales bacterium SAG-MED12]